MRADPFARPETRKRNAETGTIECAEEPVFKVVFSIFISASV